MDSPDSYRISVPGSTQVPGRRQIVFVYGAVTLCGRLSHTIPLTISFVTPICQALQPHHKDGLGCSLFARHYSGNALFSSGYLDVSVHQVPFTIPMCSVWDAVGSQQRVSPFGNPRISACSRLPEAYRSDPRPSSALSAKAFTVSP